MTITSHPATDEYRDGWERVFGVKRPCKCGHGIFDHEDFDGNIHECNARGCSCRQFADEPIGDEFWPRKVWYPQEDVRPTLCIETWCMLPRGPDLRDTWFAIARCVVRGTEHHEVIFYAGCRKPNTDEAKYAVRQKLIDRLCREGILTTEKSFSNPIGEPRIR